MSDLTVALERARKGEASDLLPLVYEELRRVAASKLSREQFPQTLQATALVHEAWLRVGGEDGPPWESSRHFFAAAAEAMRRILIDRARKRVVRQASGLAAPEELFESRLEVQAPTDELLAVNDALDELALVDAPASELVKLRYFVGMTLAEAAECLGISHRAAERLWTFARAWLRDALTRQRS